MASQPETYTISAVNLAGEVFITAPDEFQISKIGTEDSYQSFLVIPMSDELTGRLDETTVFVRYFPRTSGAHSGNLNHTTEGDSEAIPLSGNAVALPVELMAFTADVVNEGVLLHWKTASEKNNSHFEVQISDSENGNFVKVGEVKSKVTNSSSTINYEFVHNAAVGTRYYRLRQVDLDGTEAYSKVVAATVKARTTTMQVLVSPNPINFNSKVFLTVAEAGEATLILHDLSGKQVYEKKENLKQGQNDVQLPVYDKLNSGLYILTVEQNGNVRQVKVVKQ
ncbi:hypothetical protein GCM10028895_33900 [Pontibacter rugosus]